MEEQFFDYTKPLQYWNKDSQPKKGKQFQDPNFPPNENSLIGKDANGEFIDKIDGESKAGRIPVNDLEWRRASQIFKDEKYLLFEGTIEMADINQGSLGDCYFLASAAALTEYPKLIYKMFKTKEINKEGYFEIIFFIDGKGEDIVIGFQGEKDYFIFSFFGKFHYFLVAEGCSQNKLSLGVVEGNILDVWILSQGFFDFKGTVLAVYVDFICSLDPFFFIQEYYFVFNLLCFGHNLILIKEGGDCQKFLLIVEDSVQYIFIFLKIFLDFHGTVGAVYVCLKLKSRVMD